MHSDQQDNADSNQEKEKKQAGRLNKTEKFSRWPELAINHVSSVAGII